MFFVILRTIWRWFIKTLLNMLLLLSLWMGLPESLSLPGNQTAQEGRPSPSAIEEFLPTSAPSTHNPLPQLGGPFLLIQSNLEEYKIFDLSSGDSTAFIPPTPNRGFRLNTRLSPSGQKMFFLDNLGNIVLTDLVTGQVLETYSLSNDESVFELNSALEEARPNFDEMYPDASLLASIETAYQESIADIRWYQSDQYWLVTHNSTPTSTNLSLYDLASKTQVDLENQPGLVLDYRVSPGGDNILIKKGYIDDPLAWTQNRYFLLNVNTKEVHPIPMPALVDNPSLSWLNDEAIGISHQMQPVGGVHYSIFDIQMHQLKQVVKGPFNHISQFENKLLIIKQNNSLGSTIISLINSEGEALKLQELNNCCVFKGQMGEFILINCETDSLLLDENLEVTPLGKLVSLLSSAPGSDNVIIVNRDGETFLIKQNSLERQPILLDGAPLEIRWLPDGSAFLYRLSGELYLYDLDRKESTLILVSAHLSDYTNINAVWIDVD